jgi:uncharacterized protein YpbB
MKVKDDPKLKKLKEILSGSLKSLKKTEDVAVESNLSPEDLANNFLQQIFSSAWVEDELAAQHTPSYTLSKDKPSYWLINQQTKTLSFVKSGIEIQPIEVGQSNTTCLIGNCLFAIPNNIIVCNGWN